MAFFGELDGRGFGHAVRLKLDSAKVAGFAVDSQQPRVAYDGEGTAAVIAWLAEQRAVELDAIEADLRRVVPRARRLLPERAEQQKSLGHIFALEMEGGAKIPADLLSEGTLLTIGLLTVLHGRPAPRLILLDDFDRALHPTARCRPVALRCRATLSKDPDVGDEVDILRGSLHIPYAHDGSPLARRTRPRSTPSLFLSMLMRRYGRTPRSPW